MPYACLISLLKAPVVSKTTTILGGAVRRCMHRSVVGSVFHWLFSGWPIEAWPATLLMRLAGFLFTPGIPTVFGAFYGWLLAYWVQNKLSIRSRIAPDDREMATLTYRRRPPLGLVRSRGDGRPDLTPAWVRVDLAAEEKLAEIVVMPPAAISTTPDPGEAVLDLPPLSAELPPAPVTREAVRGL